MSSQSIYIYFLSASQLIFHLSFLPFKYVMLSLLAFIYNLLIIPELMVCYCHSAVTVLCSWSLRAFVLYTFDADALSTSLV